MTDLRDTDKSRYFATTAFNHCFVIRSQSLFFVIEYLWEANRSAVFTQEPPQKEEKRGFIYAVAKYYSQRKKLDDIAHEQTIIC